MNSSAVVRRARSAEIDAVWTLANSIPMAAHWSRENLEASCILPEVENAQVKALFVACIPGSGEIVGFAAFSMVLGTGGGECELENIAIQAPWRRRGLALRLLQNGLLWCRAWRPAAAPGVELWLEVRASNRQAIGFYERAGFAVTGRRTAYYKEPPEDAVLMSNRLTLL